MLMPNKTKFRKQHKGRIHVVAKGGSELAFGSFGLKAISPERVTARQIEAAPLPLPIRTPPGFVVTGTSGKIRIHNLPIRFI